MKSITDAIIKLIIAGAVFLITTYVIPWLREKRLYNIVAELVKAAEKSAESLQIPKEKKKEYVINLLKEKGVKVTPFVEALIESAVCELDILKKGD